MDEQRLSAGGIMTKKEQTLDVYLAHYRAAQDAYQRGCEAVVAAGVVRDEALTAMREVAEKIGDVVDAAQFLTLIESWPLLCQDMPDRFETSRRWLAHITYPFERSCEVFQDAEEGAILLKPCSFCATKNADSPCVLAYGATNEMQNYISPWMHENIRIKEVNDDSLEREFRLKFHEEDDYDDDLGHV
jgi:hypothetical protein